MTRRHRPPFGRGGPPFGEFRGPSRRARRGDVRTAALLLLAEEPRNGYQIMQELEERSGGGWRPSPGSVYPALAQLEDEGLVRVEEVDGRKTYALTDAGRAYVEEHELGAPWEQLAVESDVGSLFKEIRHVAMAAAQIGHVGDERQLAEARKLLVSTRRSLYALLAEDDA